MTRQPEPTSTHRAGRGARPAWTRGELAALAAALTLLLGLLGATALAGSVLWTPADLAAGAPQRLLGLEPRPCAGCALCGLSRGFALVSRGELGAALRLNPLVVLAYPVAALLAGATPVAARVLWMRRRSLACAS